MLNTLLSIFVPFLLALFLTPLMMTVAKKKNIVDMPNNRKSHTAPIPLLGGIAIFISAAVSISAFAYSTSILIKLTLIVALSGVSLVGLIDDIVSLSAKKRLVILIIQAIIVYVGLIQYYSVAHSLLLQIVFGIFVVIWIVGITNAINFSDGLDGLSSYLSIIAAISFAIIFTLQGRTVFALPIALSLGGAVGGFLPYNRNPAMIFMGDSGSMLIGFMLGLLSIMSTIRESTMLSIIVPIFILLLPIADMLTSILRRLIIRKPIMKPDKLHFHHILNEKINNHMFVAIIMSLIQIASAAFGIIIFIFKLYTVGTIVLAAILLFFTITTIMASLSIRRSQQQES